MIMYIVCIMSLVWRTGTTADANRGPMTPEDAFAFRIIVTAVLSLGLIYLALIASTLKRYGTPMDRAWHKRINGWINDRAAGSGHIPTTPVPLVDPPASVTNHQPSAEPTFNVYSTDRPHPESKSPTIRSKSSSASSHIPHSNSTPALRPPTPHVEFSFSNLARERDHGTDDNCRIIVSQLASEDENLTRDLKIPINASTPPAPFSPVRAPTPAHPLHLLEAISDEAHHEMVIDPNLSQEPIKLARLLLLSFEGDHPLDVPPLEDELKACHMTKGLWTELQTVSVASLEYLSFHSTIKPQDAQQFWYPLHPENMARTLHQWNTKIFFGHGAQIALCEAFTDAESSRFALYYFSSAKALPPAEGDNYSPLPEGLQRLDIFDFSLPAINTVADALILVTGDDPADRHGARKISLISSNLDVTG
jgi:hypothetical protein